MAKGDDLFDRALIAFVSRVSGWTIAVTAVLLYPVLGLFVPLAFEWPMLNLVTLNFLCVLLAGLVTLTWMGIRIEARERRHLVEWTTNLRLLTSQEFEWLVGELYRREGWKVRETGSQDGPDGNVDLELTKGSERRLVQCKRWTARQVGVIEIRAFAGTLHRERSTRPGGDFVTLSGFNEHAREEARKAGITLVDGRELYARVEKARRTEPCPVCQRPMMLDRSHHGWWFRCVASGCQGKRDVASDPGRAVELLTHRPSATTIQAS